MARFFERERRRSRKYRSRRRRRSCYMLLSIITMFLPYIYTPVAAAVAVVHNTVGSHLLPLPDVMYYCYQL